MSAADPISQFEQEIQYRVSSELREMLSTANDWIEHDVQDDDDADLIFVAYRNLLEDELAERELKIETGENE